MVTYLESKLTESKLLQTIIILITIFISIGSASFALSEKIGELDKRQAVVESTVQDLKIFREKADEFITFKEVEKLEIALKEFKMEINNNLIKIQEDINSIKMGLQKIEILSIVKDEDKR